MKSKIQIIQGAQWGSEAKGAIAAYLATQDRPHYAVRTGATNAGHTFYWNDTKVVMQQLPCAWVCNNTKLVLGAGAMIDPDIFDREVKMIEGLTRHKIRDRIYVDLNAYLHLPIHHERAESADRHHKIGATGKGCSEAVIDRIRLRGKSNSDWTVAGALRRGFYEEVFEGVMLVDTAAMLNDAYDRGAKIQLEGTQGTLLDLLTGPYPYTTHKPTGPAQWMIEAGLSPSLDTEIVMVARTMPIRVAGNSGPMSREVSWPILARRINHLRDEVGLPPIVDQSAIEEFEESVRESFNLMKVGLSHPEDSDGNDQHCWPDRERCAVMLSELNARAWEKMSDHGRRECQRLFELTTVTKKLRRIADIHTPTLHRASKLVRPTWVALTFMNYVFPDQWFTGTGTTALERSYLQDIEVACEAPVRLITRGPRPEHIVRVI